MYTFNVYVFSYKLFLKTLFTQLHCSQPLLTFDLSSRVGDVSWSPYSSTIFAAVTHDGKVHVYDLHLNRYKPVCVQQIIPRTRYSSDLSNHWPEEQGSITEINISEECWAWWAGGRADLTRSPSTPRTRSSLSGTATGRWVQSSESTFQMILSLSQGAFIQVVTEFKKTKSRCEDSAG